MQKILIVDDEPHIREVLRFALDKAGFQLAEAENGKMALKKYAQEQPDLVILDIKMPEMDGTDVCRLLRQQSCTPIIFLSSKDEEIDRIVGLELGGDDYITKPFSPRELVARVRAVLRRGNEMSATASSGETKIIKHGQLTIDQERFKVYWEQQEIILTVTEFGILRTLLRHPGKVFTRDELMHGAYDFNNVVSNRTIDSHVRRVRSKLNAVGADPIITVHGMGYKLEG